MKKYRAPTRERDMRDQSIPDDWWGELATRDALADIDRDPALTRWLQGHFCEAAHIFHSHAEGHWSIDGGVKDAYAKELIVVLHRFPGIVPRLLKTRDRVVKMITHRALELQKAER
jgi:hypothetical protein